MTKTEYFHIDIYETYTTKILLAEEFGTHVEDSFPDGYCQNLSSKNISGGLFCTNNLLLSFFFTIYMLKSVFC